MRLLTEDATRRGRKPAKFLIATEPGVVAPVRVTRGNLATALTWRAAGLHVRRKVGVRRARNRRAVPQFRSAHIAVDIRRGLPAVFSVRNAAPCIAKLKSSCSCDTNALPQTRKWRIRFYQPPNYAARITLEPSFLASHVIIWRDNGSVALRASGQARAAAAFEDQMASE